MPVYRVTVSELKSVFDTNLGTGDLQQFIRSANTLVNSVCLPKGVMTEEELRNTELWLSAHFACLRDPIALRSKIGDADTIAFPYSVTTCWGRGLDLTIYGQNAKLFDTSGALAELSKQKASFRVSPRENSKRFSKGLT